MHSITDSSVNYLWLKCIQTFVRNSGVCNISHNNCIKDGKTFVPKHSAWRHALKPNEQHIYEALQNGQWSPVYDFKGIAIAGHKMRSSLTDYGLIWFGWSILHRLFAIFGFIEKMNTKGQWTKASISMNSQMTSIKTIQFKHNIISVLWKSIGIHWFQQQQWKRKAVHELAKTTI